MWMFWSDLHLQSGLVRVTWQPPISAVYCLIITLITPYIYRLSSSSETYSRPRSSSGGLVWWLTVSLEGHTQFWTRHTHLDGISSREEMVLCFHRLRRRLFILLLSKAEPLFSVYFRASTSPIILLFHSEAGQKKLTVTPVVLFIQEGHMSHFCSGSVCVCVCVAWRAAYLKL